MFKLIEPSKGLTRPAIVRRRVVFPIPEDPTIEMISPGQISMLILETSGSSYPTVRSFNVTRGFGLA
jgi:hypothetical protein